MLKVEFLVAGGIITNYKCSSKCRHCSYSSSPKWPDDYMTPDVADEIFSILKRLGCSSVHIGGGEPLLKPDRILDILDSAAKNGMDIEYIETNASWYRDEASAVNILAELKRHGVHTLLISIDPFHNEYIPFRKVKDLVRACSKVGLNVFPWQMEFWDEIDMLDENTPHSFDEYTKLFGKDYLLRLPAKYGLNMKGRAFVTYKPYMRMQPFEQIMREAGPCRLLSGLYHFHVDLYGNFIPQSCPGLAVPLKELVDGADTDKYRIFYNLDSAGVAGLAGLAMKEYRYIPKAEYAGKCDLCYDIRNHLVLGLGLDLPDLKPDGHYRYV
ncbi:radical SAM domain protein [Thermoclostridium stercorarium subsp. stercorarium DSM 8532]|uniref:Radical SAM domain protein n=2 Tax=Thermoclostridium stercorarium TaxID=1510 RepID=L7VR55_THES1|nr:radical SAM protein [Thermoclostridium stercorarium]AGC69134.1 radical SAM domain protein [Thermoclostridium stercorarium subsp. stercorarium DSM 8532]AGI40103.1 radical SAM protein [Thermoclostridium stercorarium subsp. stercorarium DSM 8532]ANX02043.1 radical SAM protein [Thermoclostridium stercorarium subsp. leptospartum DSM 9219]UZQ85104.1 radical SAM protein [Thermoclostridium stercorarium]